MIRNYITQALTMMRQQKLYTAIYTGATAISLALAMTLFIVFHTRYSPAYPEYSRERIISVEVIKVNSFKGGGYINYTGPNYLPDDFIPLIKDIDGIKNISRYCYSDVESMIVNDEEIGFQPMCVDDNYWKIFDFEFIAGAPFGEKELYDAKAVITESVAKEMFARTDVVGENILVNNKRPCTIVGVVKDAHDCMYYTSKKIFFPRYFEYRSNDNDDIELFGSNMLYIEAEKISAMENIKKEIKERYARYINEKIQHNNYEEYNYTMYIYSHWQQAFNSSCDDTVWELFKNYFYIILAFLFIPALNLSGMIYSRMNSRLCEIGVRKAYGATNAQILWQILCENLFLTFIGALAGLVLSYILVYYTTDDILAIIFGYKSEYEYPAEHLFSPRIFTITLLLCFVLNIASSLLPAMLALRKNIVQSLYNKR